jgi:cytochrome c biogenesis protein CcdA
MTEELEKKLNELLGLKKQLEEITEEKQKTVTATVLGRYRKKSLFISIWFWVLYAVGTLLLIFGVIGITHTQQVIVIDYADIAIAGLVILMFSELVYLITKSKLSILLEMKQFELRITDMLKK